MSDRQEQDLDALGSPIGSDFMIVMGAQIRAARAFLGWSQSDLAQRASLNRKSVAAWEREPVIYASDISYLSLSWIAAALAQAGVHCFAEPSPGVRLADWVRDMLEEEEEANQDV